ncbi:hypothetical protein [robinz microvirus RP_32]|nr:hypothetical protein [robinz microvirus RP_32]UDN67499.1 hypothetical protein [robinz microvirus RP_33]
MAYSKNRQRDLSTQQFRSLDSLLSFKLRPPPVLLPVPSFTQKQVLDSGDRRLFQPDRSTRPPHTPRPGSSRVVATAQKLSALRFADPRFVAVCVRRKIRKEVLFALRKTRKGGGARKHKNFWSDISC